MVMKPVAKKLLIGYWPMLDYSKFTPGNMSEDFAGMLEQAGAVDPPAVQGVMWVYRDDKSLIPVFVMDRAAEIANHLNSWMDGDNDRFSLHIEQRGDNYAVVLIPSAKKSIERWKLARLMNYEEFITDDDFTVVYCTLGTCCPAGTYGTVKDKLGASCHLGFLDLNKVDVQNLGNSDFGGIVMTGPFRLGPNDGPEAVTHLNSLFEGFGEKI